MQPLQAWFASARRCAGFAPWILILAASCGEPERTTASNGGVANRPLLLAALSPTTPAVAVRSVARLHVPQGIEPWRIPAGRAEVRPRPGGGDNALYVFGRVQRAVVIPGPFPPDEFNQVAVTLYLKTHSRLAVRLLRGGEPVMGSDALSLWSSDLPQRVVANFPLAALQTLPFDALELQIGAEAGPVCFASVELLSCPLRSWLGAPGSPAELVSVAGDGRNATVVSDETPIGARLEAERGAILAFSCALPEEPRFPGQRPRLRVELDAGRGEERTLEHPLEADLREASTWHVVRIPLTDLSPATVEARFELLVDGSDPGFAFIAEPRIVHERSDPSTVVLITSDTHRADHLGEARSGVNVTTPALDDLARRGVLFERGYSTSNITVPSHVAMMTGVHPRDTHVIDNMTSLVREAATLAEAFQSRGFRTFAAVSAYHLGDALSGLGQGFDRMSVPSGNERPAAETCAVAGRWLDEAQGEPVFLWLHLFDAHAPYEPPDDLAVVYLDERQVVAGEPLSTEVRRQRAHYRGEVSYLDRELGLLLDRPRLRQAIIALTADHGECLGQHGIFFEHEELYTDTIHVPLVLAWPGAPAGVRVSRIAQNLRLGRTLLDLAGLGETPFPGRSLLEELDGTGACDPVFALAFAGRSASVTLEGWHLILHLIEHDVGSHSGGRRYERHAVELYELGSDPGCERDLAELEHVRAAELRRGLLDWLANARPTSLAQDPGIDAEALSRLGDLGYVAEAPAASGRWFELGCACAWCEKFD